MKREEVIKDLEKVIKELNHFNFVDEEVQEQEKEFKQVIDEYYLPKVSESSNFMNLYINTGRGKDVYRFTLERMELDDFMMIYNLYKKITKERREERKSFLNSKLDEYLKG